MRRLHLRSVGIGSVGLAGRIFAILLLAVIVEFAASTLLYERASHFSVREDEAHRLAEHLVIARALLADAAPSDRPMLATRLTTPRYLVRWTVTLPKPPPVAPSLDRIRAQVLAWEPSLIAADLRVRLTSPGRRGLAVGALRLPDGSWLRFATTEPVTSWDLALGRVVLALVPAAALILLGGLLLRRMLSPLRALAAAADSFGHGDGDGHALAERGPGEVRRVTRAFNAMRQRIHRLVAERTEALAAVGHDLRTPLARLQLRVDTIAEDGVRRAAEDDIAEMSGMLGSLLDFLGGDDDPEAPVRGDVAVLMATLADGAEDRGFAASYAGPEHCETAYRPVGLKRALSNLVENALHYAGAAELVLANGGESLRLIVADRGPGIPEDRLAEVLRPFARLDPARARNTAGLGLGLAIAARATEREGGVLTLANRAGGGLVATIDLPAIPRRV